MIRTILLATFLVFTTLANLICMELQLPTADPEMPWSTIGAGGVHLYAEPGLLEVRIFKRDQNSSQNTRTEMQVLLLSPDREVLERVSIPAYEGESTDGKNPVQTAVLRTRVEYPGIFFVHLLFPGNRHGMHVEWSIETNAAGWVIETARGHRDDRHREPIVMDNPGKTANISFLPRKGEFAIEAEALPIDSKPLHLYDAAGKLVAKIPVTSQHQTEIREYLQVPGPERPETSISFTVPSSEDRGEGPWRIEIPNARFYLEIDGVTRWESEDQNPNQTLWTPVADSWFPLAANRWLVTPYNQTVNIKQSDTRVIHYKIHNNTPHPRKFDLTLEFPGPIWNAKLSDQTISLGPWESRDVPVQITGEDQDGEFLVHLRATPRDEHQVTTYASLRMRTTKSTAHEPINLPLVLQPYSHENHQYGYLPDYPLDNQIYFDPENRGYAIAGRWLHRQEGKRWEKTDLWQAVMKTIPDSDAEKWSGIGSKIAFDAASNVYLLASAGKTTALLHSNDHGKSFKAYLIEGHENENRSWDIEQFSGHNTPEGPPAIVRFVRTSGRNKAPARLPQQLRWRSTNDLELIVAEKTGSGELSFRKPAKLTSRALASSMHSGIPSMIVSRDRKIHVVWGEATDPSASTEDIPGVPAYIATYDRETQTLGEPVFMNFGPPPNDSHNTPSITIDSKGYLHVVVGTHGRPFQYLRSLQPNDPYSGWTESVRTSNDDLRQTYVGLVCDDEDNLHLVFRLWRSGEEHLDGSLWAALAHQRKPAGGEWEEPEILIAPPLPDYGIYYHRFTIDRNSDLHLNYDYWSTSWLYRNNTTGPGPGGAGKGIGRAVLTSPDHGESWKFW